MKTVVPAKKRINPWKVARIVGLSVLLVASIWALLVWPWMHVFTTDMDPLNFPNLAAFLLLVAQGITVLFGGICLVASGVLLELAEDVGAWWSEREDEYGQVDDR